MRAKPEATLVEAEPAKALWRVFLTNMSPEVVRMPKAREWRKLFNCSEEVKELKMEL